MIELRQELARASAMLDVRRFDEASDLLARVVAAEPESSRAWCLMSRAHLGAERYNDAVSTANRAVSLDPADEWPHRLASNALVHLGRHADALRAAHEAARLAPGYWQTHVCVAQAALAAQRFDIAAEAATRARALAPNEPDVHFLSGKVSLARGDLSTAREHQESALALDPAHSGAMNELGRIRLRRHDTAGAIRHFISAARATPGERIYSKNIDVVLLRTVSRTIYVFTLVALILIWIPAVTHVDRLPFVIALVAAAVATMAWFAWMVVRLPREARLMVRRTLRAPRVAAALALAAGGVGVAFGLVAFTPAADLAQILPVAVVITVVARLAAFAALRGAARQHLDVQPAVGWWRSEAADIPAIAPGREGARAEFTLGTRASCSDGFCGVVSRTILDPAARTVTHLVIGPRHGDGGRLVPMELTEATTSCSKRAICGAASRWPSRSARWPRSTPVSGSTSPSSRWRTCRQLTRLDEASGIQVVAVGLADVSRSLSVCRDSSVKSAEPVRGP